MNDFDDDQAKLYEYYNGTDVVVESKINYTGPSETTDSKWYINGHIPVYRHYLPETLEWQYNLFEDDGRSYVRVPASIVSVNYHLQVIIEQVLLISKMTAKITSK